VYSPSPHVQLLPFKKKGMQSRQAWEVTLFATISYTSINGKDMCARICVNAVVLIVAVLVFSGTRFQDRRGVKTAGQESGSSLP
jgi:hypothetical protein